MPTGEKAAVMIQSANEPKEEGLNFESRQVFWVEIGVLVLEVTAGVDSLEDRFSVRILAVSGTVAVDDDVTWSGSRPFERRA